MQKKTQRDDCHQLQKFGHKRAVFKSDFYDVAFGFGFFEESFWRFLLLWTFSTTLDFILVLIRLWCMYCTGCTQRSWAPFFSDITAQTTEEPPFRHTVSAAVPSFCAARCCTWKSGCVWCISLKYLKSNGWTRDKQTHMLNTFKMTQQINLYANYMFCFSKLMHSIEWWLIVPYF